MAQASVNATHFENIPPFAKGAAGEVVHAVIETPSRTRLKYEFEPDFGIFKLKQVLPDGLEWPYDYGFVPRTLADDGDPIDILVLSDVPTFTGCLLECRILGIVRMRKDGVENDRLIAAPVRRGGVAQTSDVYEDVDDIPKETMDGICRFLVEYSAEEGHEIEFKGVKSRKKGLAAIEAAMETYDKRHH
ncbi:MAG: inorganic diphosphatase [Candidatus Eremiobacteraeota bacterium]|nr:inorganic diphosphatase [Candidatus Eremiobacteraeota bacterium]